jgi:outer membrane receptor protein involved in Fe transport
MPSVIRSGALLAALVAAAEHARAQPMSGEPPVYETVVTAPETASDPSAAVRSVPGETLARSARGSVFEAVAQETPGLYASARGPFHGVAMGASGGLRLRGLGGSPNTEVVVLEDGVPNYMGIFGHPIPDTYFPSYVESVEVLPGGDSVLFGGGAMGGVIDIRTAWPVRNEVRLSAEAGSFATQSATAGFTGKAGQLEVLAAARVLHSDGHREFAGGDSQQGLLKLRLRLSGAWSVVLRQRTLLMDTFDPGPASRPFFDHRLDVRRFNQSLAIENHGARLRGRVVVYGNVGWHRLWDGFRSRDDLGGLWAEQALTPWPGSPAPATLTFGLDARTAGATATNLVTRVDYGSHRRWTADPYAQLRLSHERGVLVAGGRLHVRQDGDAMALGKLGGYVPLPGGFFLAARLVQNYRDPTLAELHFPFPVGRRDLRPERSTTVEASAGWRFEDRLALEATAYQTRARDYIRVTGAFPVQMRENLQSVKLLGVEGLARLRIAGPLSLRGNAALTERGPYTAQTPALTMAGALLAEAGTWRAEVSGFFVGGLYQRDFAQDPLAPPWSVDARIDKSFQDPAVRFWVAAQNLTNHRYAFIADYPMPGINIRAGLELTH